MTAPGAASDADARFDILADNLPNGLVYQVVALGAERKFLYISRGVETLFGVSREAAMDDSSVLYRCIAPEYVERLAKAEAASIGTGVPFLVEVPMRTPSGINRWVQISSARRITDAGQEVWDGIVLDITARRQSDITRDELEGRLEVATEAASIGIWQWDLVTNRLEYSPRARAIYGFSDQEDVTYEKLRALTLVEDFAETSPALSRALDPALRQNETYRYRIRRSDTGEVRWVLAHGKATFAEVDGKMQAVSYVGTLQDITEQANWESRLQESEERLRVAIGAGQMAVWEMDLLTGKPTISPELCALYGFGPEESPVQEDFRKRYAPGERERIEREATEFMQRGETQMQFEAKHIWPDGTVKWLAIRAQLLKNDAGVPVRAIGVVMDVTERRTMEDRLAIVARELQHRVKNSLSVVQTIAAQTFRPSRPYAEALPAFTGRLQALAVATDIITRTDWMDGSVAEIVDQVTQPYRDATKDAFRLSGPEIGVPSKVAVGLGMALHELCTNALKFGALSGPEGLIDLEWREENDWLEVTWRESGGPVILPPVSTGFGSRLLTKGIFEGPSGSVELRFHSEGVVCFIRANVSRPEVLSDRGGRDVLS